MTEAPEPADVPWAMQLAIRYDKAEPAGHIETAEPAGSVGPTSRRCPG